MPPLSTLADEWQRYDQTHLGTYHEHILARAELRHAFMAGATVMFTLLMDGLQEQQPETVAALHIEVTQWLARMQAGPRSGAAS